MTVTTSHRDSTRQSNPRSRYFSLLPAERPGQRVHELRAIGANPETAIDYALVWMADVLRALGAENDL